jgi:hypothetical protein
MYKKIGKRQRCNCNDYPGQLGDAMHHVVEGPSLLLFARTPTDGCMVHVHQRMGIWCTYTNGWVC